MAEPMQQSSSNGHDTLDEALARLSKKPGVKATIALDRVSGAILKTSGNTASLRPASLRSRPPTDGSEALPTTPTTESAANGAFSIPSAHDMEMRGVEHYSALVWAFVNTAGALVNDLEAEDELKLLRLRTKKQELVIVLHPKYLLILVHDTP
ncbi:hypothetical protein CFIMG_004416RA [Ceratocystis fimbriata CBS 114723]|uniref:Roadblock/LAMTOR2 domain-containing protein n=2 Tax=Ceratocystis TaxID=5157 RepID=A0A2C5WZ17_9PEZI|nr:hypothetical protein CFIMG_004416RA [Ceratocystis fimbriata CBS 114723]